MPMSIFHKLVKWLTNYDDPQSPASRVRARRIAPLLAMIESIHQKNGSVEIIDIGGTEEYWRIIPRQLLLDHNVSITIVNLPKYVMPADHDLFKFIGADACNLSPIADQSFDIAHSNSVLEHVGDWNRMIRFAEEIRRVSNLYFVQTPNYWFPIEPHSMMPFFNWLPKPIRLSLVQHYRLGNYVQAKTLDEAVRIVEGTSLLNKPMFQALFWDADILTERYFFLPKSFIAVKTEQTIPGRPALIG